MRLPSCCTRTEITSNVRWRIFIYRRHQPTISKHMKVCTIVCKPYWHLCVKLGVVSESCFMVLSKHIGSTLYKLAASPAKLTTHFLSASFSPPSFRPRFIHSKCIHLSHSDTYNIYPAVECKFVPLS